MPDPTLLHIQTRGAFSAASGADDGIPLLLLAVTAPGRWWERCCAALPDEIYAVAPDLRGCGQSDKPDGGYTVEEQTADIAALADALRWQTFTS
ncbi:MAG: hypothetical protein H6643_02855 [Caldilineaceae bacterium]|nr:hypothetical protein [Caldilineaceae bacterium]